MSLDTNVVIVPPSFPARYSNSNAAYEWLQQNHHRFEMTFFHSCWSLINLRLASLLRQLRKPYMVISHGSLDPFDLRKKSFAKRILGPFLIRPYLNGGIGIICSTSREARLLETYGATTSVHVLPWAVKKEVTNISREEARASLEVLDDRFLILFFGRIDYKKGFPILIPAFRRLLLSGIKAELLIVGPETRGYGKKLRILIKQSEMGDSIRLFPPTSGPEKMKYFKAADCFALSSLNENFGNAVVEAMQARLPVVVSNNVYICEQIAAREAGIVCNYDIAEVTAALAILARDKQLRSRMGENAESLGNDFTPQKLRPKYAHLIRSALQAPQPYDSHIG
jgi:glycosyltransferase involved in cell wall biosynthesis